MSKRPSRGVSSGIGSPTKMTGRDGDLTIRKTKEGKILFVKEHGSWHPINTGVDTAKLKKDVDRLIRSVNTLRSDNNPFPTINSLNIRKNVATATVDPKITFTVAGTDEFVMGVDTNDSDKFKIDTGSTIGGSTALTCTGVNVATGGNLTVGSGSLVVNKSYNIGATAQLVNINPTLNSNDAVGGTQVFNALKVNITDDASDAWETVNLMDFQVGGTSKLKLDKAGAMTATGAITSTGTAANSDGTSVDNRYLHITAGGLIGYRTASQIKGDVGGAAATSTFTKVTLTPGSDGDVTFEALAQSNTDDKFTLSVNTNGVTTLSTVDDDTAVGHLNLVPDGNLVIDPVGKAHIDKDINNTTAAANNPGLHVDYDRIGAVTSGTDTNIGIDLDVDVTGAGTSGTPTVNTSGMDIDVVGDAAGSGTSTATGIEIDVDGADTNIGLLINTAGTHIKMEANADVNDYGTIAVADTGDMTITTIGNGTTDSDLILDVDGDINMDAAGGDVNITSADLKIAATKGLYFDGGGDTYIYEVSSDSLGIKVGGDFLLTLSEYGDDGNEALFKTSCATFTRNEATFSETNIIESVFSHATDIDFRHTNKFRLEMTDDIHTMNLIFPRGSGNFLLVCETDGDHDVSNWKVYENDETAATTTDVMWAGGNIPVFTDDGVDIVSFYWDSIEQQAYGTASLAFATP